MPEGAENPIQEKVQKLVEGADFNKDNKIDEKEKILDAENLKLARQLREILIGIDEDKKAALDRAIEEMVDSEQYDGLTEDDIYRWIRGDKAVIPELPEEIKQPDEATRRFGKPPERSDILAEWEVMNATEKREALLKGAEVMQTQQRRVAQLDLLITALQGKQMVLEKGGQTLGQKAYQKVEDRTTLQSYSARVNEFLENKVPQIRQWITEKPDVPLRQLLQDAGAGYWYDILAGREVGVAFKETTTDAELQQQGLAVIRYLRDQGDYLGARRLAEGVLTGRFNDIFRTPAFVDYVQKEEGERPVEMTIAVTADEEQPTLLIHKFYQASLRKVEMKMNKPGAVDQLVAQGMPLDEAYFKMDRLAQSLAYQDYLHQQNELVGAFVHDQGLAERWDAQTRAFWEEFKDSAGIGATDLSDENWDMVLEEAAINAPLILISGGVASAVRAGLSTGAKAVIGAARVARLSSSLAGQLAMRGAGLAVEGLVFEMTNAGLRGEWLLDSPDWVQRSLWACGALGMFKMGGRIGEVLLRSPARSPAGHIIRDLAGNPLMKDVYLGKLTSKITNQALRKGVEELVFKGHIEVALMLTLGAAQHGVATGFDMDEFFENFGEELFHAYVSVGALKTSGRVMHGSQGGGKKSSVGSEGSKLSRSARAEGANGLGAIREAFNSHLKTKGLNESQLAAELRLTEFTPAQRQAILDAHAVGEGRALGSYTRADLYKKGRILLAKGPDGKPLFTRDQAKQLLDKGIAGVEADAAIAHLPPNEAALLKRGFAQVLAAEAGQVSDKPALLKLAAQQDYWSALKNTKEPELIRIAAEAAVKAGEAAAVFRNYRHFQSVAGAEQYLKNAVSAKPEAALKEIEHFAELPGGKEAILDAITADRSLLVRECKPEIIDQYAWLQRPFLDYVRTFSMSGRLTYADKYGKYEWFYSEISSPAIRENPGEALTVAIQNPNIPEPVAIRMAREATTQPNLVLSPTEAIALTQNLNRTRKIELRREQRDSRGNITTRQELGFANEGWKPVQDHLNTVMSQPTSLSVHNAFRAHLKEKNIDEVQLAQDLGLAEFTLAQQQAILDAHAVGEGRTIGSYTRGDKIKKGRILLAKGPDGKSIFTRQQAQQLLDRGIAGVAAAPRVDARSAPVRAPLRQVTELGRAKPSNNHERLLNAKRGDRFVLPNGEAWEILTVNQQAGLITLRAMTPDGKTRSRILNLQNAWDRALLTGISPVKAPASALREADTSIDARKASQTEDTIPFADPQDVISLTTKPRQRWRQHNERSAEANRAQGQANYDRLLNAQPGDRFVLKNGEAWEVRAVHRDAASVELRVMTPDGKTRTKFLNLQNAREAGLLADILPSDVSFDVTRSAPGRRALDRADTAVDPTIILPAAPRRMTGERRGPPSPPPRSTSDITGPVADSQIVEARPLAEAIPAVRTNNGVEMAPAEVLPGFQDARTPSAIQRAPTVAGESAVPRARAETQAMSPVTSPSRIERGVQDTPAPRSAADASARSNSHDRARENPPVRSDIPLEGSIREKVLRETTIALKAEVANLTRRYEQLNAQLKTFAKQQLEANQHGDTEQFHILQTKIDALTAEIQKVSSELADKKQTLQQVERNLPLSTEVLAPPPETLPTSAPEIRNNLEKLVLERRRLEQERYFADAWLKHFEQQAKRAQKKAETDDGKAVDDPSPAAHERALASQKEADRLQQEANKASEKFNQICNELDAVQRKTTEHNERLQQVEHIDYLRQNGLAEYASLLEAITRQPEGPLKDPFSGEPIDTPAHRAEVHSDLKRLHQLMEVCRSVDSAIQPTEILNILRTRDTLRQRMDKLSDRIETRAKEILRAETNLIVADVIAANLDLFVAGLKDPTIRNQPHTGEPIGMPSERLIYLRKVQELALRIQHLSENDLILPERLQRIRMRRHNEGIERDLNEVRYLMSLENYRGQLPDSILYFFYNGTFTDYNNRSLSHDQRIAIVEKLTRGETVPLDGINSMPTMVLTYIRCTPEQRLLAEQFKQEPALQDVPLENLYSAAREPVTIEGLPDAPNGSAQVYFINHLGQGGLGVVREGFYRTAEGKIVRLIIKSALISNRPDANSSEACAKSLREEAVRLAAVQAIHASHPDGVHPHLMEASPTPLKDSAGNQYLVMKRAGNRNAYETVYDSALNPVQRIQIMERAVVQVMSGIQFLHQNGLVHRDVKLANIVWEASPSGSVHSRVVDLGLVSVRPEHAKDPRFSGVKALNDAELAFTQGKSAAGTPSNHSSYDGKSYSEAGQGLFADVANGTYRPEYDYISLFNVIAQAGRQIGRQNIDAASTFGKMFALAERIAGIPPDATYKDGVMGAKTIQEVADGYAQLKDLASSIDPASPINAAAQNAPSAPARRAPPTMIEASP